MFEEASERQAGGADARSQAFGVEAVCLPTEDGSHPLEGPHELLDVAAFRDQESFQAVCQRDRDLDSLVVVNLLINIKKASV